jgi:hypothetical protein
VIRSVEKSPDKLLPPNFAGTFAVDWLDDAISGQHPFSALIVGPMAEAANVPHSNPVIGVVADEEALGKFRKNLPTPFACWKSANRAANLITPQRL